MRTHILLVTMLLGCGSRQAPPAENWDGFTPENAAALKAMIAQHGRGGPLFHADLPPRATFDWDNTMMRQDMGDAVTADLLLHNGVFQPAGKDWAVVSHAFSPAALAALHAACDAAGEPGQPLQTAEHPACASQLWSIYADDKTDDGEPAFTSPDSRTSKHAYALGAQLLAGHTPADVKARAQRVFVESSARPTTETLSIGKHTLPAWVRVHAPMGRLVNLLQARGFDVWVVSASPQPVVEAAASHVGVGADHVVGIGSILDARGRLTARLTPCGSANPDDSVITYMEGKRCFINQRILKLPPTDQMKQAPAALRPVFAAGDSDTDLYMLLDATALRVVINRNKNELMCHAYNNQDGHWRVQPLFMDPLPQRALPFACGGYTGLDGAPLSDQPDRVHGL